MDEKQEYNPGFVIYSEAWYAVPEDNRTEIQILDKAPGGGTRGEFAILWYVLGQSLAPRIEAFGDSWEFLAWLVEEVDLVSRLARLGEDPAVAEVAKLLIEMGIEDRTPRKCERNSTSECPKDPE